MRARALIALVVTPLTAGVVYAIVDAVLERSASPDYRTGSGAYFVVGCLSGLAFEFLVLLPLAHFLGKWSRPRMALWLAGSGVWLVVSLVVFGYAYADSSAVIPTALQVLIPGAALSAVFAFLFLESES